MITDKVQLIANRLSQVALGPAEIASVLLEVERDVTLVHAAYYTDDECIDRIARWIAGKD